jgi:hypothetical protein
MNASVNNLLREVRPNNKERLTVYNRTPTKIPFQMNMTQNGKYILFAHGYVYAGYSFNIPKNINFITLTRVSDSCEVNPSMDKIILDFYRAGNTIFKNDDLGKDLTDNGERLLITLQTQFDPSIDFKNHLGGKIANEMVLNFSSSGEGQQKSVGIIDLGNQQSNLKNMKNLINLNKSVKINQILLSSLLTMYSLNASIKKTFIICACRSFNESNTNANKELSRTISGTRGRARGSSAYNN